jgi:scyllo-inositol 2-dehydrogenase (NADP+)
MIRIAVVGLGKMGLSHLAILRTHPNVKIVAVCDSSGILLSGLNRYTGLKTYSDFGKLLEKEPLDAVFIATPSRFHDSMVKQALDKNLHVFCEKPFCLDVAKGQELAALAGNKGVINQVGYHYRYLGTFIEAKRLLAARVIGKIHHIRAEAYGPVVLRPEGTTWRSRKMEGGGCLYEYACHAVDLLHFLYTVPICIEGTILNRIYSAHVDDEVYATFRFPDDATGQLAANWSDESFRKMAMQFTIWGTNGRMRIDRQEIQIYLKEEGYTGLRRGWNTRYSTELTQPVWFYLRGEEYSTQIDHFVRSIQDRNRPPLSTFETALQTDIVLSKMIQNASGVRPTDKMSREPALAGYRHSPKGGIATMVKGMFRRS